MVLDIVITLLYQLYAQQTNTQKINQSEMLLHKLSQSNVSHMAFLFSFLAYYNSTFWIVRPINTSNNKISMLGRQNV